MLEAGTEATDELGPAGLTDPLLALDALAAQRAPDQQPGPVGSFVTVIIGAIFVICVLVFRRGLVGETAALYRRVVGRR